MFGNPCMLIFPPVIVTADFQRWRRISSLMRLFPKTPPCISPIYVRGCFWNCQQTSGDAPGVSVPRLEFSRRRGTSRCHGWFVDADMRQPRSGGVAAFRTALSGTCWDGLEQGSSASSAASPLIRSARTKLPTCEWEIIAPTPMSSLKSPTSGTDAQLFRPLLPM